MKKTSILLLSLLLSLCLLFSGCELPFPTDFGPSGDGSISYADLASIPAYSGSPYVILNNDVPTFTEEEITDVSYEFFSPLDSLGRCGYVEASVGVDLMPTEDRESISSVTPSGWINKKYDCVDGGGYLYNRAHLLGFQLTGENANKLNLITGTRYMNVEGMLPFENMIADYVKETENHVMYRVTPIYLGNNLVAHGVQLEACSVEDNGEDISFNVYVYNVQPEIVIDYATGESFYDKSTDYDETAINGEAGDAVLPPADESDKAEGEGEDENASATYILNTSTKKVHYPNCSYVDGISAENKRASSETPEKLLTDGYTACKRCTPFSDQTDGEENTEEGNENENEEESTNATYILNTNSKKIHYPNCSYVDSMSVQNKLASNKPKEVLMAEGYTACNRCKP